MSPRCIIRLCGVADMGLLLYALVQPVAIQLGLLLLTLFIAALLSEIDQDCLNSKRRRA